LILGYFLQLMLKTKPKKILIITNKILKYRDDFYRILGKEIDLTVIHHGSFNSKKNYRIEKTEIKNHFGFYYYKGLIEFIQKENFDVIISIFDLRFLNIYSLITSCYRSRLLFWGIGISTENGLKEKKVLDYFRLIIASKAKGLILYSQSVKDYYISKKFSKNIFVAVNSTKISKNANAVIDNTNSFNFIFVGSLAPRKGVDFFLKAFSEVIKQNICKKILKILIVGEGPEKEELKGLVEVLNLQESVCFYGKISDPNRLTELYKKSLLSFSINQAGLSVLQSLGNGVPVIASEDAITGGELYNIIEGETGFLVPSGTEEEKINYLTNLIIKVIDNEEQIKSMRVVCRQHYLKKASLKQMKNTFITAINTI